jgi:hypothetical protein
MPERDPAEAVRMLDLLLAFFGEGGERWARRTFNDGRGGRLSDRCPPIHRARVSRQPRSGMRVSD